jgi:putative ABC transport system permease protein
MNTLKSAIRNARKNGVLSFAKLFGITISFAVIMFATGYVYYETSFDKCIPENQKIYRCIMEGKIKGKDANFAVTSPEMANAIVKEIPEIDEAIRIAYNYITDVDVSINYNNNEIDGGKLIFADLGFFSLFDIHLEKAIQEPFESENNIAISKNIALKYFGSVEEALNKVVELSNERCVITGVFDDFPKNFHLQTGVIQSIKKTNPDNVGWGSQTYITYFKTNSDKIDIDKLNFKLTKTVFANWASGIDAANAKTWDDLKWSDATYLLFTAEPLKKIHFSKHRFDPAVTSSKTYVYGAIILAILVLLISSINFINLTIANISTRFKELGIRKTTGAHNAQIAGQLLFESLLFWTIGFVLAIILYQIGGKQLTQYLNLEINISNSGFIKIIALLFIGLLIFNILTNIIPVLYISNKKVLNLVKDIKTSTKGFSIKDSFVSLQFILSAIIILSSIMVQKQIDYMVNMDRGYDTDNVLMLDLQPLDAKKRQVFIEALKEHTIVENIATSSIYLGKDPSMNSGYFDIEKDENFFHTSIFPVDNEFLNTFNIKLKEGRFFEKERQSDFNAVVLNESALKEYNGDGSIIGHELLIDSRRYGIIGVVKDFNFRSLCHKVQPLVFLQAKNRGIACINFRNDRINELMALLQMQWDEFNISFPMKYEFHDEVIAKHYAKDRQAKSLLLILSIVSILIACVGLYAISYFSIIRKTKEIGIRKVNGAKIAEVMAMLNRDLIQWVAIAFLIAVPISYYVMSIWLESFAYKTELSWWIFALTGVLALGIALLTVSWQSWKAATRNPVEALRYE